MGNDGTQPSIFGLLKLLSSQRCYKRKEKIGAGYVTHCFLAGPQDGSCVFSKRINNLRLHINWADAVALMPLALGV